MIADSQEDVPQGLKPRDLCGAGRPKAKALGYLEAKNMTGLETTVTTGLETTVKRMRRVDGSIGH